MLKTNNLIWKGLNIISWIIFIGLCIQAGSFIVSTVVTMTLKPGDTGKFWKEVDLSAVYAYDQNRFLTLAVLLVIVTILKALLFYFILRIFHDKNLDLYKLFNETIRKYIVLMAYLALGIGFFAAWGSGVADNLVKQGIEIPALNDLKIAGYDVWILMGISLLIIDAVFKKGIALQNENDLTV
jgi:hypothetical protein